MASVQNKKAARKTRVVSSAARFPLALSARRRQSKKMSADPIQTLLLPFETGEKPIPEKRRALFMRAEAHPAISFGEHAARWKEAIVAVQSFKPAYDALAAAGFVAEAEIPAGRFRSRPRAHHQAQAGEPWPHRKSLCSASSRRPAARRRGEGRRNRKHRETAEGGFWCRAQPVEISRSVPLDSRSRTTKPAGGTGVVDRCRRTACQCRRVHHRSGHVLLRQDR